MSPDSPPPTHMSCPAPRHAVSAVTMAPEEKYARRSLISAVKAVDEGSRRGSSEASAKADKQKGSPATQMAQVVRAAREKKEAKLAVDLNGCGRVGVACHGDSAAATGSMPSVSVNTQEGSPIFWAMTSTTCRHTQDTAAYMPRTCQRERPRRSDAMSASAQSRGPQGRKECVENPVDYHCCYPEPVVSVY